MLIFIFLVVTVRALPLHELTWTPLSIVHDNRLLACHCLVKRDIFLLEETPACHLGHTSEYCNLLISTCECSVMPELSLQKRGLFDCFKKSKVAEDEPKNPTDPSEDDTSDPNDASRSASSSSNNVVFEGTKNKYQVIRELGRGDEGAVYEAKALTKTPEIQDEQGRVAIKEFHSGTELDYMKQEVDIGKKVGNVIDEPATSEGKKFLVMQFYDGKSLRAELSGGIDLDGFKKGYGSSVDSLRDFHEKFNVFHGDTYPQNVVVVGSKAYWIDYARSVDLTGKAKTAIKWYEDTDYRSQIAGLKAESIQGLFIDAALEISLEKTNGLTLKGKNGDYIFDDYRYHDWLNKLETRSAIWARDAKGHRIWIDDFNPELKTKSEIIDVARKLDMLVDEAADGERAFTAIKYFEGETLFDLLNKRDKHDKPISIEEFEKLVSDAKEVLDKWHDNGVMYQTPDTHRFIRADDGKLHLNIFEQAKISSNGGISSDLDFMVLNGDLKSLVSKLPVDSITRQKMEGIIDEKIPSWL